MTLYASKTPRDLNRDPEPMVEPSGRRAGVLEASGTYEPGTFGRLIESPRYDPRPEFDHAQHNAPNPILIEFREKVYGPDADIVNTYMDNVSWWIAWLSSPKMQHGTFMTGAGTPPLCSCGWQGKNHTGPILADHQREARQHVNHARRVLARLEMFA